MFVRTPQEIGTKDLNPREMTREQKIEEIQRRVALGVSVKRACIDLEVPRPTYYTWINPPKKGAA